MAQCRWLKPRIVVAIDFLEWTLEDRLRHPSFVALTSIYSPRTSLAEDDAREYLVDTVKRAVSLPRSAQDYGVSCIAIDEQHLHLLVFALRKEDVAAHPEVLAHFLRFECDRADLLIGLIVR
jgi:hypothetical protein